VSSPGPTGDRRASLQRVCVSHAVEAVYLFGSRADDGCHVLTGGVVDAAGSDLDIGLLFVAAAMDPDRLAALQVALEDVFAPLRVDLVPLDRVDALFQFHAVDGIRVYARDSGLVDRWELVVMRRAAELLPIQRQLERDLFGVSTS
jgi:predicted nucleotidyltransferase